MAENDALAWLMEWYASHCDGEWEHGHGVSISTLDNPGWRVRIDLQGTVLESAPFEERRFNYDDDISWWICKREGKSFEAACGARELIAVIGVFRDWATQNQRQRLASLIKKRSAI